MYVPQVEWLAVRMRILLGADSSKRDHRLQFCSIDKCLFVHNLEELKYHTVTSVVILSFQCSHEKTSASRSTLRPERADRTALQPDCRKGHRYLHLATLYVTLQMDSLTELHIPHRK